MRFHKTTGRWSKYWKNRKIDWKLAYHATLTHPHRQLIVDAMRRFLPFARVLEVGCATSNLIRTKMAYKWAEVGGVDISEDAIAEAKRLLPQGMFDVRPVHDMWFDTNVSDVTISDACLIYYGPTIVGKALKEMGRVTHRGVVLCEFHSESWLSRMYLKLATGYNAYNWPKLLKKHGYYDIKCEKFPKGTWEGMPWTPYGHIITAKVPYCV